MFAGGVECGGRSHLPLRSPPAGVDGRHLPERPGSIVFTRLSLTVVQTVHGFIRSLGKRMEAFLVAGRRPDGVKTEGPALRELTPEA